MPAVSAFTWMPLPSPRWSLVGQPGDGRHRHVLRGGGSMKTNLPTPAACGALQLLLHLAGAVPAAGSTVCLPASGGTWSRWSSAPPAGPPRTRVLILKPLSRSGAAPGPRRPGDPSARSSGCPRGARSPASRRRWWCGSPTLPPRAARRGGWSPSGSSRGVAVPQLLSS